MGKQNIYNRLYTEIKNPYGVIGAMCNLRVESNFLSTNMQNCYENITWNGIIWNDVTYTDAIDSGIYTKELFFSDRYGYGLCQWTTSGRKAGLYDFAKSQCKSIGDEDMQIDYFLYELNHSYKNVLNVLKTATSIREASDYVCKYYERPRNQSENALANRASYGEELWSELVSEEDKVKILRYSNSSLVTYTKISPNKTSPRNHIIDTITIHCFVGQVTAQSGCNAKSFITYNVSSGSSCNYVVGKDGSIGLCVEEKDRSWCSSNKENDHRAITIEVASDTTAPYAVTDAAFNSLIKLCADICKRNNIKKLIWSNNKAYRVGHINGCNMTVHRDYAAKSCPGQYLYERHGLIAEKVNKLLGASTSNSTITPTPSITRSYLMKGNKGEEVKTLQENLNYLGFSCGNIDGDFGTKTETALKKFQTSYRLTVDGKYGEKSKTALEKAVTDKKSSMSTVTQTDSNLNYNLVFNATYYANKYADLKKAFGTNATQLLQHFKQYGMAEGRQAIDSFCVQNYKNRYPDLQKAFGNDLKKYYEHYMNYGYRENRNGR